ncbi:hypothetical protein KY314_04610 [Candidatus Woesearchaeota archaeon]|nr:hypothetical protein [Candidatus Woesearchaeota archaeon]
MTEESFYVTELERKKVEEFFETIKKIEKHLLKLKQILKGGKKEWHF